MSLDLQPRLDFALHLADESAKIILPFYQSSSLAVESKRDSSPVTAADRGAELRIRELLAESYPDDAILGEEFGEKHGTSGYKWILDPVDGTKSFIHGVPLFGTLIGVESEGRMVIGVCNFPALGERAWGATGLGAWWSTPHGEPRRAQVSTETSLARAVLSFTTVAGFARIGRPDAFEALTNKTNMTRGWGDCYGHYLVATGRVDVMVDPLMNPWDAAALVPIIEEAGGSFCDWNGESNIYAGNGISLNAGLRESILAITRRPQA